MDEGWSDMYESHDPPPVQIHSSSSILSCPPHERDTWLDPDPQIPDSKGRIARVARSYEEEEMDPHIVTTVMVYASKPTDAMTVRLKWFDKIGNEGGECIALVDTGAEVSSVSTAFAATWAQKGGKICDVHNLVLQGVGGCTVPIKESCIMPVQAILDGDWIDEESTSTGNPYDAFDSDCDYESDVETPTLATKQIDFLVCDSGYDVILSRTHTPKLGLDKYLGAALRRRYGDESKTPPKRMAMNCSAIGRAWKASSVVDTLSQGLDTLSMSSLANSVRVSPPIEHDYTSDVDFDTSSEEGSDSGEDYDEKVLAIHARDTHDEDGYHRVKRSRLEQKCGYRSRGGRWREYADGLHYPGRTPNRTSIRQEERRWKKAYPFNPDMDTHAAWSEKDQVDTDVWAPEFLSYQEVVSSVQDMLGPLPEEDDIFEDVETFLSSDPSGTEPTIRDGFSKESVKRLKNLWQLRKKVFNAKLREGGANVAPLVLNLLPGREPKPMAHRRFSAQLQSQIDDEVARLLETGVIRTSLSRYSSELVMVKQKDKWRMCVDYTEMNKHLEGMQHPIPNIREILDRLQGKKFIAKLDLRSGYQQFGVDENSKKFTAFRAGNQLYEYNRIPFGLKMAPAYFQCVMQEILKDYIGTKCFVYVDDIIIFGDTELDFEKNLSDILKRLDDAGIVLRGEKCVLSPSSDALEVLGYELNDKGVTLTAEKCQGLLDMQTPKSLHTLRSFNGLANYFRPFVPNFANMMKPLTEAATKNRVWSWSSGMNAAFTAVKQAISSLGMLYFIDDKLPLILRTDASQTGVGGILFQRVPLEDGLTEEQPVAFVSKAFNQTERNWSTIEQEGFAIFHCVMKLQHYLKGRDFEVETDHRNLTYMASSLTPKVIRWKLRLLEFDFVIRHIAGVDNVVADGLSRCLVTRIVNDLAGGRACNVGRVAPVLKATDEHLHIISQFHNPIVGHFAPDATAKLIRGEGHSWPTLQRDVEDYIAQCWKCQKTAKGLGEKEEVFKSLMTERPFRRVSIDTVGPLPPDSHGNKYIMVAIDNFTRVVELKATEYKSAHEAGNFMLEIFARYGPPEFIHSDNGGEYVAKVIERLISLLKSQHSTTLPYRPQANGLVERVNGEVMRHLTALTMSDPTRRSNWSASLPLVARILNYSYHSAIGTYPAKLLYGINTNGLGVLLNGVNQVPPEFRTNSKGDLVDVEPKSWLKELVSTQKDLLAKSQAHQRRAITKRVEKTAGNPSGLAVGSFVMVLYQGKGYGKLTPRWRGPFLIVEKVKANEYRVQHLNEGGHTEVFHIDRLKLYLNANNDAAQAALTDHGEDKIDCIIEHCPPGPFRRGQRKQLDFKVRWEGFNASHDVWIPYKEMAKTEALGIYMEENGLELK
jgi:hypothetical protein